MTLTMYKTPDAVYNYAFTLTVHTQPETYLRYCTSIEDMLIGGVLFTACPAAFFELAAITHDLSDDDDTLLYLPESTGLLSLLAAYISVPDITVQIEEVNANNDSDREILFIGKVDAIVTNPSGNAGFIGMPLKGPKALLNNCSLGEVCYSTCRLGFGGSLCGVALAPLASNRTILNIVKNKITLDGAAPTYSDYFAKGFMEIDGIPLFIVSADNLEVVCLFHTLTDTASLIGKTVTIYPGCDKQYLTCKNRWANELKFKGLARNMPSYSPYIGNVL